MKRERRKGGRETGSGRETVGKQTYTGRFFRELDFSEGGISSFMHFRFACLGGMALPGRNAFDRLCDLYVFGYHRYV